MQLKWLPIGERTFLLPNDRPTVGFESRMLTAFNEHINPVGQQVEYLEMFDYPVDPTTRYARRPILR